MNGCNFIAQTTHRWLMPGRLRRARRTVFGLLAPLMLMAPVAHARDVPDGWQVRRENNGVTFAPVEMNPGEKLEVWVATKWYEVRRGASLPSQLPQIRQQAGAMEGDPCQPPKVESGMATQQCMAGNTVLQYMLLPAGQGGYYVHLVRLRVAGDGMLDRHKNGFRQVLDIVMENKALAALKLEGERIARAIRTAPGQGVQDGDIAAVFVTEKSIRNLGMVQRIEHTTWLLLKAGTGYQNEIPPDELNIKVSRQLQPERWVQWRKPWLAHGYEIRGQEDKDWRRLPEDGWIAQPARPGERLNSAYEHASNWGGGITAKVRASSSTWHFSGDGTFKTSFHGFSANGSQDLISLVSTTDADSEGSRTHTGATYTDQQTSGGVTVQRNRRADDGASRRGRYRLKGWVLEAQRDDGQTDRHFVTFRRDQRDEIDIDGLQFFQLKEKNPSP